MRRFLITTIAVLLLIPIGLFLARDTDPSETTASDSKVRPEPAKKKEQPNPCADDPGHCYQQGIDLAESPDFDHDDFPRLRQLFGDACDAGWALACQDRAMMAEQGIGEEIDLEKALGFYEKACSLGHELACTASRVLLEGGGPDWGPDLWFERCVDGDVEDCIQLGLYLEDGGEFDADLDARELFEAACNELDESACYWFGRHLEKNDKDASDATIDALYRRACDAGIGRSCSTLASRLDTRDTDPAQVAKIIEKACELEDGHGCYYLGLYHMDHDDEAAAIDAWRTGCDVWHDECCNQLGLAIVKDQRDEAGEYFERACQLNLPAGCYNFGVHLNITHSPPPFERSRQLFERACRGEHYLACAFLANMLRNGQGGPQDLGRAAELAALACQNGIDMACE